MQQRRPHGCTFLGGSGCDPCPILRPESKVRYRYRSLFTALLIPRNSDVTDTAGVLGLAMHGYKILSMRFLRSRFDWTWAAMHMASRDMFPCARHSCQAGRPTNCVCKRSKQCRCSHCCVIDNARVTNTAVVIDTSVVCRLMGAPGTAGCGWSFGRLHDFSPNAALGKAYSVVKHVCLAKLQKGCASCAIDTATAISISPRSPCRRAHHTIALSLPRRSPYRGTLLTAAFPFAPRSPYRGAILTAALSLPRRFPYRGALLTSAFFTLTVSQPRRYHTRKQVWRKVHVEEEC